MDHEALIIGAGFSGIGMAIALDRAGLSDFLIVEEGHGFGGTWYWNRYPGVAVDIPSFSYQYSFAIRTDWSRVYAPGAELRAYAEHCAQRGGLHARTRFGTRVTATTFDEDEHVWRVETDAGDELTVRHVIDATGVLTQPKAPDIEGVESFAGTTLHTARWDEDADLKGKRVAVIGTGASAVQLLPAIADDVEHVTVFQRTPIWCFPKLDAALPERARTVLGRVPGADPRRAAGQPGLRRAHVHRRRALPPPAAPGQPVRAHGAGQHPPAGRRPRAAGQAHAALLDGLQAPELPQRVPLDLQPRQRRARDDADRADHAGGRRHRGRRRARGRRARARHRLQGLRRGQLPQVRRSPAAAGRTSRRGGPSTATRPTRASASRASRTTSRCSGPTATTARPTST